MLRQLAGAVLAIAAAMAASAAEARDPEVIGNQRVNNREERIVFRLGPGQGRLDQIRFRSDDGMLLRSVEIIFEGGKRMNMEIIDRVPPGAESRPIGIDADLRGVEQVTLWKRPSLRPGMINVQLIGVLRPEPPRGGQFSVIDSQTIDIRNDRVVFRVGRREGRFAAIKFRPVDGPVLDGWCRDRVRQPRAADLQYRRAPDAGTGKPPAGSQRRGAAHRDRHALEASGLSPRTPDRGAHWPRGA